MPHSYKSIGEVKVKVKGKGVDLYSAYHVMHISNALLSLN